MKQVHDLAITEVTFEYTGTGYSVDDLEEIARNTLEFQTYFESLDWTERELEHIRKELVATGKVFAKNQGFSETMTFSASNGVSFRVNTGRLVNGIKADPISKGQQKGISFYNDAKNDRQQPYAGHLEYGFHDRGGNFIPARPFMRPAFFAVAEGSKGNFQQIMKGLLDNLWKSGGYRGIWQTEFGRKAGSQSNFWTKSNFSGRVGNMSRISQLRGMNHRGGMSMFRNSKSKAKGIKSAKNRRDYRPKGLNKADKKAARQYQTKQKSQRISKQQGKRASVDKSKAKPKTYSITQREFGTKTVYTKQFMTSDGKVFSNRVAADNYNYESKLNGPVTKVMSEKTVSTYNSKTSKYRVTTRRGK